MVDEVSNEERLAFLNKLIFESTGGFRFTQDSPILANVWMSFALNPAKQQELILTIDHNFKAGYAVSKLREMLLELRRKRPLVGDTKTPRKKARIAYIPGQIAIKLYFDELMRIVLPLTPWWHEIYGKLRDLQRYYADTDHVADWHPFPQPREDIEEDLTDALITMRSEVFRLFPSKENEFFALKGKRKDYINSMPAELCWVVRIAGIIGDCFESNTDLLSHPSALSSILSKELHMITGTEITTTDELKERLLTSQFFEKEKSTREAIVRSFTRLYEGWSMTDVYPTEGPISKVTRNRRVHLAIAQSSLTVKADAAKRVFDISCRGLTWAVIDSGIDSNHSAFKLTTDDHLKEVKKKKKRAGEDHNQIAIDQLDSRVIQTLDFTSLRDLLNYDVDENSKLASPPAKYTKLQQEIIERIGSKGSEVIDTLRSRIINGKEISWEDLEPALVIKNPGAPVNDHGTHVAGILGADWIDESQEDELLSERPRILRGICPDVNLIDVRVFREDGLTDEFELLAAIQFLRWMNTQAGTMQVHGANISLSLVHEVRRFACGQTPVCIECNEAVAAGMVIVAAAGNRGFRMAEVDEVRASDSYQSVSITDPGNAEKVITVGSTHRKRPHEYGVSYFSSRGPTGDGRLKPDLVAPGEKIYGPTINNRAEYKDGTSMAAPHVSGAAAMLMARNSELIGQPEAIKKILCDSATDLGRERYFQGSGLVDILRALQSR